jgi:hypothetical protein
MKICTETEKYVEWRQRVKIQIVHVNAILSMYTASYSIFRIYLIDPTVFLPTTRIYYLFLTGRGNTYVPHRPVTFKTRSPNDSLFHHRDSRIHKAPKKLGDSSLKTSERILEDVATFLKIKSYNRKVGFSERRLR